MPAKILEGHRARACRRAPRCAGPSLQAREARARRRSRPPATTMPEARERERRAVARTSARGWRAGRATVTKVPMVDAGDGALHGVDRCPCAARGRRSRSRGRTRAGAEITRSTIAACIATPMRASKRSTASVRSIVEPDERDARRRRGPRSICATERVGAGGDRAVDEPAGGDRREQADQRGGEPGGEHDAQRRARSWRQGEAQHVARARARARSKRAVEREGEGREARGERLVHVPLDDVPPAASARAHAIAADRMRQQRHPAGARGARGSSASAARGAPRRSATRASIGSAALLPTSGRRGSRGARACPR